MKIYLRLPEKEYELFKSYSKKTGLGSQYIALVASLLLKYKFIEKIEFNTSDSKLFYIILKGKTNESLYKSNVEIFDSAVYSLITRADCMEILNLFKKIRGKGISDINLIISFLNCSKIAFDQKLATGG